MPVPVLVPVSVHVRVPPPPPSSLLGETRTEIEAEKAGAALLGDAVEVAVVSLRQEGGGGSIGED